MTILSQNIKSDLFKISNNYKEATINKNYFINGCSVIIPIKNQWEELIFCLQSLSNQKYEKIFEIILIDDNSFNIENLKKVLAFREKMSIRIFKVNKNIGAAAVRNIGIVHAQYNLLVFLDCDMIIPKNFLAAHTAIHSELDNIVSVSFRKHTLFDYKHKKIKDDIQLVPSFKFDFRYKKFIPRSWQKSFLFLDKKIFGHHYSILDETDNFKNFGFGKSVGIWTLPFMVVGSSVAVKSKHAIKVGGFDERFFGAWYEDTFFGAKLIAIGLKIIPIKNITAYHLVRTKRNSNKVKDELIIKNKSLYYKLINKSLFLYTKKQFINKINKQYESITTEIC